MKKGLLGIVLALFLAFLATVSFAEPQIPPAPTGSIYVADYAGVLSPETKARINDTGQQLSQRTKAQIVAVTVKSLHGQLADEYGLTLLRKWGIGDKQLNNGVLLLVAVEDRKSRIEVGYGLEGALPDAKTGQIQDDYLLPYFRQGDYDKGILNTYMALTAVVAKEYNVEFKNEAIAGRKTQEADNSWWNELPWWAKFVAAAIIILLFLLDWIFLGGNITFLILSLLRFRGGGNGNGGYGGGSGGGGGSNRNW